MFEDPVVLGMIVFLVVFGGVAVVGFYLVVQSVGDQRRAVSRLRGLAAESTPNTDANPNGGWVWQALPLLGDKLLARQKDQLDDVRSQLLRAGYFQPNAPAIFLAVKLLLMVGCTVGLGLAPYWLGLVDIKRIPMLALFGCATGMMAPGFWLKMQVHSRQRALRNSLPDALDMLVLCLEGGVTLQAALQRVTDELFAVHPVLGGELNILQREVQLGLSPGAALKKFADRCGLNDVRDLAAILLQAEKFGASVTKALRVYAEGARIERQQKAEENAQKAAVKILFPTLLCIFPAIFIVLLGPAAMQMQKLFAR